MLIRASLCLCNLDLTFASISYPNPNCDGFFASLSFENQSYFSPSPSSSSSSIYVSSSRSRRPAEALKASSSSSSSFSYGASLSYQLMKEEEKREERGNGEGEGRQEAEAHDLVSDDSLDANHHFAVSSPRLCFLDSVRHSYMERFAIRCYEVGMNGSASIETIANLFQEVACNHVQSVGFSTDGFATTPSMRKRRLIWVTARLHIEVEHYPTWGDVVEVETWCQGEGKVGIRRDWLLTDVITKKRIGRATSTWVMMNQDSRRLSRITDDIREEYEQYCPIAPRYAFPEDNSSSLKKIPKLQDPQHIAPGLRPRRGDLDMNQHVNNVTYIGWVLESMPQDILETHQLHTITLDYRRECNHSDVVDSLARLETSENTENTNQEYGQNHHGYNKVTAINGNSSNSVVINGSSTTINEATSNDIIINGSSIAINGTDSNGVTNSSSSILKNNASEGLEFLHFLRLATNEIEINRGRTVWKWKEQT